MKRILFFLSLLLIMLNLYTPVIAASVPAQTCQGNDANDYTPPEGCIHYQIPDSDMEGTHTVMFNNEGIVDTDGSYSFAITIGTIPGNDYTQVLSWSSNFPIHAVIVKGEPGFNIYQYDSNVFEDSDLVVPLDPSGCPDNVCHVSIVICQDCFPPEPTATPVPTPKPTMPPSPTPCPPSPCPPKTLTCILIVNTIFQIISTILLGILAFFMFLLLFRSGFNMFGTGIIRFHKKSRRHRKHDSHNKEKDCDNKQDKDYSTNKDKDYDDKKYKSSKGYSLDCNNKNAFPYTNNYHDFFN